MILGSATHSSHACTRFATRNRIVYGIQPRNRSPLHPPDTHVGPALDHGFTLYVTMLNVPIVERIICRAPLTLSSLDAAVVTRRRHQVTSFALPSGGAPAGASTPPTTAAQPNSAMRQSRAIHHGCACDQGSCASTRVLQSAPPTSRATPYSPERARHRRSPSARLTSNVPT